MPCFAGSSCIFIRSSFVTARSAVLARCALATMVVTPNRPTRMRSASLYALQFEPRRQLMGFQRAAGRCACASTARVEPSGPLVNTVAAAAAAPTPDVVMNFLRSMLAHSFGSRRLFPPGCRSRNAHGRRLGRPRRYKPPRERRALHDGNCVRASMCRNWRDSARQPHGRIDAPIPPRLLTWCCDTLRRERGLSGSILAPHRRHRTRQAEPAAAPIGSCPIRSTRGTR
jgi:hypothetical protein